MVINLSPSHLPPSPHFPSTWTHIGGHRLSLLGRLLKNSEPSSLLRACEPESSPRQAGPGTETKTGKETTESKV